MTLTPESKPCDLARDLGAFVSQSPTSYHAVRTAGERLRTAGFAELHEAQAWELQAGGKYFVIRDGAFIAWIVPGEVGVAGAAPGGAGDGSGRGAGASVGAESAGRGEAAGAVPGEAGGAGGTQAAGASAVPLFNIFGTHTDSPAFKLAPDSDFRSAGASQAGVEIYGGPLLNAWLDRELKFAGQLTLAGGTRVLTETAAIGRIPQLAIHLDRGVNDGLKLDKQRHMQPVISLDSSVSIYELLAEAAGVAAADVVGMDVYTIPAQEPALFGAREEFLASPRLDNLSSVHAGLVSLEALARDGYAGSAIAMVAAFDHEEVGSETRSGASGPFLADVTERVISALGGAFGYQGRERETYLRSMSQSVCVSSDAGHAVHPNYPERHDPVVNPLMGQGPLLKLNAQQRYASDAVGTAVWAKACEKAGVSYQPFVSNNTVPCGSTIGPLTATRLGMTTVDVGAPLWSMHSAREMVAVDDYAGLLRAAHAFLQG